jgi:hypothetical protein
MDVSGQFQAPADLLSGEVLITHLRLGLRLIMAETTLPFPIYLHGVMFNETGQLYSLCHDVSEIRYPTTYDSKIR